MPEHDLQQLGILVTRPAHQAEGLCQLIEQAGGRAIRFPTLAIKPATDADTRTLFGQIGDMDIVIFISPNAVSFSRQFLPSGLPENIQIACVGAGTARQLTADFGKLPDIMPESEFNSEALLALHPMTDVAGKQIMIVRGNGGRPLLGDTLRDRGAKVIYATVYIREIPAVAPDELGHIIAEQNIAMIVVTSGAGLKNLLAMADAKIKPVLREKTLVLPNQRLRQLAEELGFSGQLLIAGGNRDEDILSCIQQQRS
ncbi:MAG: uroporphyrinogen-III synthase [Gammaproteobacteria bacterium]|nr:uroporphyrinogen-III synthase [Gammaproteobacteria bacterium]